MVVFSVALATVLFPRIQFGHRGSPHVPSSHLVTLSPRAQHPRLSPHQAKYRLWEDLAEMLGMGLFSPLCGPPLTGLHHLPLWLALQTLSTWATVYCALVIKIVPRFSFFNLLSPWVYSFLCSSLVISMGFSKKGEKMYMFETVILIIFFINQYHLSKCLIFMNIN